MKPNNSTEVSIFCLRPTLNVLVDMTVIHKPDRNRDENEVAIVLLCMALLDAYAEWTRLSCPS